MLREALVAAEVPDEYIRALDAGTDLSEIMDAMTAAGVLPDGDDLLDQLLRDWAPLLKRGADPMTVEMSGVDFVSAVRVATPDDQGVAELFTDLIERAEKRADAPALAILRLVAATAPDEFRAAAATAADRLAATGLKDPKWAADIGAPTFVTAFGYRDPHGAQQAIALVYAYGRRQHGFVVLIDHDLGGGIKDVWPTDDPKEVRAQYRLATRMTGMELRVHDPAETRAILDEALAQPPCPMQEDQIEGVDSYLDLLRRRVGLLPASATTAVATRRAAAAAAPAPARAASGATTRVHRLKVTLRGSKPPIWRRLEVASDTSLTRLHVILQEAFGWHNQHMWGFETPAASYGVPDRELGHRDAARTTLKRIAPRVGDPLAYVYDFGDYWDHIIAVEDVSEAEPGVAYPRCIGGRRAAPPEDCSGIGGYAELLTVLADPAHVEHQGLLEWLDLESAQQFDPAAFDVGEVNEALAPFRTVLVQR
jgi:hypothetical protein